jgi:hypothetical protein
MRGMGGGVGVPWGVSADVAGKKQQKTDKTDAAAAAASAHDGVMEECEAQLVKNGAAAGFDSGDRDIYDDCSYGDIAADYLSLSVTPLFSRPQSACSVSQLCCYSPQRCRRWRFAFRHGETITPPLHEHLQAPLLILSSSSSSSPPPSSSSSSSTTGQRSLKPRIAPAATGCPRLQPGAKSAQRSSRAL